jgi:hypothetical protein
VGTPAESRATTKSEMVPFGMCIVFHPVQVASAPRGVSAMRMTEPAMSVTTEGFASGAPSAENACVVVRRPPWLVSENVASRKVASRSTSRAPMAWSGAVGIWRVASVMPSAEVETRVNGGAPFSAPRRNEKPAGVTPRYEQNALFPTDAGAPTSAPLPSSGRSRQP